MSDYKRRLVDVRGLADRLNISVVTAWRQVGAGRLPAPVYPSPGAPRWDLAEIDAALETTRALPSQAKEARRQAKLATAS